MNETEADIYLKIDAIMSYLRIEFIKNPSLGLWPNANPIGVQKLPEIIIKPIAKEVG